MSEYVEVTRAEREAWLREGIFDINGNMPFHPGYTGIHHKADGSYVFRQRSTYGTEAWFTEEQTITDPSILFAIEHRDDPAPEAIISPEPIVTKSSETFSSKPWWKFWS